MKEPIIPHDLLTLASKKSSKISPNLLNYLEKREKKETSHFYSYLGDIILCPKYIEEVMMSDIIEYNLEKFEENDSENGQEDVILLDDDEDDDELEELEPKNKKKTQDNELVKTENDEEIQDRGVSLALSKTSSLKKRYPLLLIHSILHLAGHDHEEQSDWLIMAECEEYLIEAYYFYKKLIQKQKKKLNK